MYRKINNQIGSYNTLLKPSKLGALDNLENEENLEIAKEAVSYFLFDINIDR